MFTEGALAMYSSTNCIFYLCTGVVVTIYLTAVCWRYSSDHVFKLCPGGAVIVYYNRVLEIQQRPCIRAVYGVSSNCVF